VDGPAGRDRLLPIGGPVAVYALGDRTPDISPDAYVHPDATVIGDVQIAAGASVWPRAVLRGDYGTMVSDRTEVPARAMALGIPAKMRLDAVPEGVVRLAADMYVENAARYKAELRRLD
jgi:carbonic anhydrase/acetyltransferase-like protein (isoleucine patch superfamily)